MCFRNQRWGCEFLEPHGTSPLIKYARLPDIFNLIKSLLFTEVDTTTQTEKVYHLTKMESKEEIKKLQSLFF